MDEVRSVLKGTLESVCRDVYNYGVFIDVYIEPIPIDYPLTNQAVKWSPGIKAVEWNHLKFRSKSERALYHALRERGLTFSLLPTVIHSGSPSILEKQFEPGSLLFHAGRIAVVEVDGSSHDSKTSE